MLTPQRIQEYVESVIERDGIEGVKEFTVDVESYGEPEEDDWGEANWYFAVEFFEDKDGNIDHSVVEDTVDHAQYYRGFGSQSVSRNAVAYFASFPVGYGTETFTLKEVLDELFYEGYDTPSENNTIDDVTGEGFVS